MTSMPVFEISGNLLTIESIGFIGCYSKSPNGRYTVGFQDFDYQGGSQGGYRSGGFGRLLLIDGERILYHLDIERPNDAIVANNGMVAVNDWLFADNLAGTFYVIAPGGQVLIEHDVKANLFRCGITNDGQIAWCNTCASDYKPDSDKLFIFSVPNVSLVAKLEGRDDPEEIIATADGVSIKHKGYFERFDYQGNLLNPEEVRDGYYNYLLKTSPYHLLKIAGSILQEKGQARLSDNELQTINLISFKVLNAEDIDNQYKARAHRFLGESAQDTGNIESAIDHYRIALALDPKVGIKTTLTRLEKQKG